MKTISTVWAISILITTATPKPTSQIMLQYLV